MNQQADSWKLTLPCTRDEAELLGSSLDLLADLPEPPVLMSREPDPARPDSWLLEAYFETEPDDALIAAVRALVPSAAGHAAIVERLAPADWLTLSQQGLAPVRAGRFFVCTPAHAHAIPSETIAFIIEASLAFGTGHHETTAGCLEMLDRLKQQGARFSEIADIGTGTGLLAFAAQRLWPRARVIASDIDPVAIEITAENATINGIATGRGRNAVELIVAAGLAHPRLRGRAPYDLLIANILAGPLIEMAPVLADAVEPGGSLILAGLLDIQAEAVANAYRRHGMRLADRIDNGDWPALRLVRRRTA